MSRFIAHIPFTADDQSNAEGLVHHFMSMLDLCADTVKNTRVGPAPPEEREIAVTIRVKVPAADGWEALSKLSDTLDSEYLPPGRRVEVLGMELT